MNFSLMSAQMMRVISSPSSSTTGFLTLIFVRPSEEALRVCCDCNEVGFDDEVAMRALSAARREVGCEAIVLVAVAGSDVVSGRRVEKNAALCLQGAIDDRTARGKVAVAMRGECIAADSLRKIASFLSVTEYAVEDLGRSYLRTSVRSRGIGLWQPVGRRE